MNLKIRIRLMDLLLDDRLSDEHEAEVEHLIAQRRNAQGWARGQLPRLRDIKGPFLHRFTVIPDPEEGDYIVMFPSLVGCGVVTATLESLGSEVLQEYQRWIKDQRANGRPIPPSDVMDVDDLLVAPGSPDLQA